VWKFQVNLCIMEIMNTVLSMTQNNNFVISRCTPDGSNVMPLCCKPSAIFEPDDGHIEHTRN